MAERRVATTRPLDGVRVLDLSRVVSGPLCGRILADLGADVVKVEPPTGDSTRLVAPAVDGISPYFAQMNAGKRNICIDLKSDGACEVVARLADSCDVLIENFRPGVLDRLGLGAHALMGRNPRLVYCSITGWGQDGPWRDRRAYAPIVQGETGMIELAARMRARPPEQEVQVHGDVYPALLAANAVTAALYERERTGVGSHLDVAMGEVLPYVNEWTAVDLQRHDAPRGPFDVWTHHIFATGDGTGVVFVGNPLRLFPTWVRALGGHESLLLDARFATEEARDAHASEVVEAVATLARGYADFGALERAVEPWGVMVAEVRSVADLAESPWAAHRGLVTEVQPGLRVPSAPWRIAGRSIGAAGPAVHRGTHNHAVLAELGYSDDEIAALDASGVLR